MPRLDIPDLDPRDYFTRCRARAGRRVPPREPRAPARLARGPVRRAGCCSSGRHGRSPTRWEGSAAGGSARGILVSARRRGRALAGDASARRGLALVAPPLRALDSERGRLAPRPGGRRRRRVPPGRRRGRGHTRPCRAGSAVRWWLAAAPLFVARRRPLLHRPAARRPAALQQVPPAATTSG